MRLESNTYVSIYAAKDQVIKTLQEYGSLTYSRLLMITQSPENVLNTVLELLVKEGMVDRTDGGDDPEYRLTPFWRRGQRSSSWPHDLR
jgi:hypothetical protein